MIYKICTGLLLYVLCIGNVTAQKYAENRSVTRRFKVTPGITLDINNKYGKIEISTWDKDSVKIEASLSINTTNSSKIMKLRDIDFDFSCTSHYIVAKTVFKSSGNNFVDELKTLAESIVSNNSDVKIDYLVTTPKNMNIRLVNKYGDVYADDLEGDIQMTISNGGLKANDLSGNVSIDLSFGNGYLGKIDKGRLTLSYADVVMKSSDRLTVESKSSKFSIDNVASLKIQSRRDKFTIGSVTAFSGDSYFTDVRITNLTDELGLNSKFGTLSVENIRKGFSFVHMNSELTDIDLFFEHNSQLQYDITYYKDALVRLPKEAVTTEDKALNTDMTQKILLGHVGSGESNSKVKISAPKKASIHIFIK